MNLLQIFIKIDDFLIFRIKNGNKNKYLNKKTYLCTPFLKGNNR